MLNSVGTPPTSSQKYPRQSRTIQKNAISKTAMRYLERSAADGGTTRADSKRMADAASSTVRSTGADTEQLGTALIKKKFGPMRRAALSARMS